MGALIQEKNLATEDFGDPEYEGCTEMLNISKPVTDVYESYLEAGASSRQTRSQAHQSHSQNSTCKIEHMKLIKQQRRNSQRLSNNGSCGSIEGKDEFRKKRFEMTATLCNELLEAGAAGIHLFIFHNADVAEEVFEKLDR
ncbi:MAG: hypothetical protein OXR66_00155 [Candidatus Woesearchaeota archaeon]|nr:hypothetical protein [Candidatus Woesearchaeota archaeon]